MAKFLKSFQLGLALVLMLSVSLSCKNEAATKAKEDKDHLEALEESLNSLKDGNGEVMEISDLKKALPEELISMKRTSHNGQRTGMAGIKIATAEADYEDGDRKMSISIVDTGGLGLALASLAAWSESERDNESSDGYERTTMINGNKALEKYNRKSKQGEISMISDERFIVSVNTSNLSESDMRKVISKIKIKS